MEVLNSLKGRPSLIDVRDRAALESALYHLPTVFTDKTLPAVVVSFAAICIRDSSALLSSPTLQLTTNEITKITALIRSLTTKINKTVKSIRPRVHKDDILGRSGLSRARSRGHVQEID